jgi:hypothetical protein
VHIAQLFDPLARRPDVEIIEAPLPHVLGAERKQFPLRGHAALAQGLQDTTREALFDGLHDPRGIALLRFADEEMNVIGHGDVHLRPQSHNAGGLVRTHGQKPIASLWARQPGLPMVTAAGDEVQLLGAVVALGMVRHQASLLVAVKKKM